MTCPDHDQGGPASGGDGRVRGRAGRIERREQRRAARHAEVAPEERERSSLWQTWSGEQDYFRGLCMRWLRGNRHDAEDVMSEAAIKLMELGVDAAAAVQNPRSWIGRVLHNLCADLGRRCIRARAIEDGWSTIREAACERAPDAQLHGNRVGVCVADAVDGLPEYMRSVLVMRMIDGLDYKEISSLLGITSAAARKRAQLARDELKVQLADIIDAVELSRRGLEAQPGGHRPRDTTMERESRWAR